MLGNDVGDFAGIGTTLHLVGDFSGLAPLPFADVHLDAVGRQRFETQFHMMFIVLPLPHHHMVYATDFTLRRFFIGNDQRF